jgi:hypothetical protein
MTPDEMRELAFKNSKYVKIEDGGSVTAKLVECKAVPQQRDPDKETYRYTLEFEDGSKKFLESTSNGLLRKMAEVMGKKIQITREGEGPETRYEVFIAE